jgi:hypothetical protein
MKKPSFKAHTELARYISPDERRANKHAVYTAFLMNDKDNFGERQSHLSVNTRELEPIETISEYYQTVFQNGQGEVAICLHRVIKYVDEGRKFGLVIRWRGDNDLAWVFDDYAVEALAFKYRPVREDKGHGIPASLSHCGVEFLRALTDVQQRSFARRMVRRPKFAFF